MRAEDRKMLMDLLLKAELNDKEFIILARRYGLDEKDPLKPAQLATMLNMLEFEVRKVCRLGLFKLREHAVDKDQFDSLLFAILPTRPTSGKNK
jgi:DNA-directed RNA polymerase sigma subunit (sigma70/sigma32)